MHPHSTECVSKLRSFSSCQNLATVLSGHTVLTGKHVFCPLSHNLAQRVNTPSPPLFPQHPSSANLPQLDRWTVAARRQSQGPRLRPPPLQCPPRPPRHPRQSSAPRPPRTARQRPRPRHPRPPARPVTGGSCSGRHTRKRSYALRGGSTTSTGHSESPFALARRVAGTL